MFLVLATTLFNLNSVFADTPMPPPPPTPDPPPDLPIDSWLLSFLFVALFLGFTILKSKNQISKS